MKEIKRCDWCQSDALMQKYHDEEWGLPVLDDIAQFEHMLLEIFQAGLSWMTVLRKREAFSAAFARFDPAKVVSFGDKDIARLLNDAGIIRNRLKINAAVNNAARFIELSEEFGGFYKYLLRFKPEKEAIYHAMSEIPAQTLESQALSKELKKRGFKFVGPTICYAHMQAVGIVNDHKESCFRYDEIRRMKSNLLK